jgi:hypothetical protein
MRSGSFHGVEIRREEVIKDLGLFEVLLSNRMPRLRTLLGLRAVRRCHAHAVLANVSGLKNLIKLKTLIRPSPWAGITLAHP